MAADFYCKFLDIRSFNTFSLFAPCPSPPKSPLFLLPIHPSRNPRRRRKSPCLSMLPKPNSPAPSSPELCLISTDECSDGSIVFRFGDMNKVARNIETEESEAVHGRLVSERTESFNVVRVLDGGHERHVVVKEIEGEVRRVNLSEVADIVNNVELSVRTKDSGVNDGNSAVATDMIGSGMEWDGIFSEDTQEIELPVFEEIPIEMSDCTSSEMELPLFEEVPIEASDFEAGDSDAACISDISERDSFTDMEKSTHTVEGLMGNHTVEAEGGDQSDGVFDEGNVIGSMPMYNRAKAEQVLSEEAVHGTLEEFIDAAGNESLLKVGFPLFSMY